jgi:hypothetical protein
MRSIGGVLVVLLLTLSCPPLAYAQATAAAPAPELSVEQIKTFLKTAKVIRTRSTDKGVTAPKRLTLSDGVTTHDAVFQAIDEYKQVANLSGGRGRAPTTELRFVDSYKYNIAAYELARLLELDHMMPVYVERRVNGMIGSISWMVPTLMDEGERLKKKLQPPDPNEWNNQMYRMRAFSSLVRDTDRNLTNVLVSPEWKVVMIDFSRGFRLQHELQHLADLNKIDRRLLARLESLSRPALKTATKEVLNNDEVDAVMARRDLLVAHFKKRVAELGEDQLRY